ncbi:acid sphingomyelinase-like phosphodiesterase 3a [Octopus sinensis]|uniref:Acid sphingomyelinase-like phosphodiesterase 3a n=1 Tax=Octopus sinensis TaxID=2607531 RepID=A0A6P7U317_9MOLL|nr:acid sphingomyelinase-like phosphodiesterase 3a [Octopus sinensis]
MKYLHHINIKKTSIMEYFAAILRFIEFYYSMANNPSIAAIAYGCSGKSEFVVSSLELMNIATTSSLYCSGQLEILNALEQAFTSKIARILQNNYDCSSGVNLLNGLTCALCCGYYSQSISAELEIVVLNSVHWIYPNTKSVYRTDPADQFDWLKQKLLNLKKRGKKVLILSHVPPGHEPNVTRMYNVPKFNTRLTNLLGQYENIIVGVLCGHLHHDAIFADPLVLTKAIYAAPSLSRLTGDPGVRLYSYNRNTGEIVNYQQFYMTEERGWVVHTQNSVYGVLGNSAEILRQAVKENICTYIRFFTYLEDKTEMCDKMCIQSIYCASLSLSPEKYNACMKYDFYYKFLEDIKC